MATLEKRGSSYRIIFRFRGRKYARSLGTDRIGAAQLELARLEENLRKVKLGLLEIGPEDDIASLLLTDGRVRSEPQPSPPKAAPVTLSAILQKYVDGILRDSLESNSLNMLKTHVRNLQRHFGDKVLPSSISLEELQNFVNARSLDKGAKKGSRLSPTTIRKELTTLAAAWDWARECNLVADVLPNRRRLRYPKVDEKPPFKTWDEIVRIIERGRLSEREIRDQWDCVYLNASQILSLLAELTEVRGHRVVHSMIATAAYTGARRSELLRSQIQDVDLESGTIALREKKRIRGQRSIRVVPISPPLRPVLHSLLKQHDGGPNTFSLCGRALSVRQAHAYFRSAVDTTRWRVLRGWHVLRHSFISNCASKGVDQRMIDDWVGHQTEAMRKRYRHLFPNVQQQAIADVFRGH